MSRSNYLCLLCILHLNEIHAGEFRVKTYRFNCFYDLPNSLAFTVFEKKFNSLSELAKFVMSSNRIYLDNPREQLNSSEFQIFSKKMQSLFNNRKKKI